MTIYELQQRAVALRSKTQTASITPDEVGGLHVDTLAYIAEFERETNGLGIRKVYRTKAEMEADTTPIGTNGKTLQYGQLVCIYNEADNTNVNNGDIYAYQKPGWLRVGNISHINKLLLKINKEEEARKKQFDDLNSLIARGLTVRFNGILDDAEISDISVSNIDGVYYISSKKIFAGKSGGNYVGNWTGADMYLNDDRTAILKDKVYLLGATAFAWSDEVQALVDVTGKVKALVTAQGERITTLQGYLSTLQGSLSTLQQSVTSEATEREEADKEIEKKIEKAKKEVKDEANTSADLAFVYSLNRASASFEGFVDNVSLAGTFDKTITPEVYFDRIRKTFVGKDNGGVYILLYDLEGDIKTAVNAAPFIIGGKIVKDKIYKCKDKLYCWDDAANNLVQMGNDGGLKIVMHNADEHTFVLTPDALHVWPEVTQLHLTFAAAEDGYVGEYAFQFTCPEDAGTTLELPAGIKWYGGKVVVPEAGKTYQASVVNDVIIMGGADEFV